MPRGGTPAVRVGLKVPQQGIPPTELRAIWRLADDAGFDHLWGFDHFVPIFEDAEPYIYEGWMTLAAMAENTRKVRIGLIVTASSLRHPGVLAKMAVTVDHLSAGRLEFGIGAGSSQRDHDSFGLPARTPGQRIDQMREAVQVIRSLWTQPRTDFAGAHYQLSDAFSEPKPVQRPHPPIWIGGSGERKTLRVVAELADAWNVFGVTPEEAARLSGILDQHCADIGRDPRTIRRSIQIVIDGANPRATAELAAAYLEAGFPEAIVSVRSASARRDAEVAAAEVLPAIRTGVGG